MGESLRSKLGVGACAALVAGAVWVRGLNPGPPPTPEDRAGGGVSVREPMQLLAPGARLRVRELDLVVDGRWQVSWRTLRGRAFAIQGCPGLKAWLEDAEGQRVEQLLSKLRNGGSEDALAALVLVFQLARSTSWESGLLGGASNAEKLGELLGDWLRVWGERAAEDPLLHEPALAAALLYGRVMRMVYAAPVVGRHEGAYGRARSFLWELCGTGTRSHTAFGRALATSHPRALAVLENQDDCLAGLSREARARFPELDGACGR